MLTRGIFFVALAFIFSAFNANLKADERSYVWTYEYMIMDPGKAEIETYTTFSGPAIGDLEGKTSTELNFETEIGMTEHFDFAIYQNFKQAPEGGLTYSGFKLRSRFKIGKKDQFFMDPLIYVEYKGKPDFHEHEIEAKFILAKDLGNFNISLNPYFEMEFEDGETEFAPKYAVGASYKVTPLFSFGLEAKGSEDGHYLGPTISHGAHGIWVAWGMLFGAGGIEEGKSEFMTRFILGIHI